MIHREIDVDLFGVAAAYKNLARHDPQMQFALACSRRRSSCST